MAYSVLADLYEKISEQELILLTDDIGAGAINTDRIEETSAAAAAEIDGYVGVRYLVPVVAPIPALLKLLSIDIQIYRLYGRRARPQKVIDDYKEAMRKLEHIAKGMLTLGIPPPPAAGASSLEGEVFAPERLFTRTTLEDF